MECGGDLKIIGFLTGMCRGYTKHMCFLCLWDSRAKAEHYVRRHWPDRSERVSGHQSIEHAPLVQPQDILLPSLHIKLGLFKNFIKSLDPNSEAMCILRMAFPKLSEAKLKEGIFVGPDVRKIIQNEQFRESLNDGAKSAFDAMVLVLKNF